jgi:acyl-CoA dehydrogenase
MSVAEIDDVARELRRTASDLFARHGGVAALQAATADGWSPELWAVTAAVELPLVDLPARHGGSDGTLRNWVDVLHEAARHGAPIPLAETGVAGWLLAAAGANAPLVPMTVVEVVAAPDGAVEATAVPSARAAEQIVVLDRTRPIEQVGVIAPSACAVEPRLGLSGEPRDTVRFLLRDVEPRGEVDAEVVTALARRWALARSAQMAGALQAVLALAREHAARRVQFGRPIARLPVIRERLVLLAEEAAVADAAVEVALRSPDELGVAVAKIRTGEAAGTGARIAHQIHGAIGMSDEHALHHFTRRLWAWRGEAGDECAWAQRIGTRLAAGGPAAWEHLTGTLDG